MAARAGEAIGAYDAGISSAQAITMGADVVLSRITRGIYIGGAGNIEVQFAGDADANPVALVGLAVGVWHPMQIQKIINAGTTATDIVGGY